MSTAEVTKNVDVGTKNLIAGYKRNSLRIPPCAGVSNTPKLLLLLLVVVVVVVVPF